MEINTNKPNNRRIGKYTNTNAQTFSPYDIFRYSEKMKWYYSRRVCVCLGRMCVRSIAASRRLLIWYREWRVDFLRDFPRLLAHSGAVGRRLLLRSWRRREKSHRDVWDLIRRWWTRLSIPNTSTYTTPSPQPQPHKRYIIKNQKCSTASYSLYELKSNKKKSIKD